MLSRLRRLRGDAGVTLVELMVSMAIFTLLGAMALTWFVGSNTANKATVDANITTASARNALQSWAGLIRLATPASGSSTAVTNLTATSITFSANLGALPSCSTGACVTDAPTTITLSARSVTGETTDQLVQQIGTASSVIVPSGVHVASGCIFTAYDATGASLGCSGVNLTDTRSVQIGFTVETDTHHLQSFQTMATFTASTT
jgi:prepilin-type N-terminal cleavage/methylation domain-containing protein